MKQILTVWLILCSLFFSACNDSTSIGIIGGSDGPTSVIVSDNNGDSVKKPLRMIKVDGKLYYDSGKVSDMTPRCGTLDGELKQVGAAYEIPKHNGECNFEGAEGYQNATGITKEVPIGDEWVIFKLFDNPEYDMDVFKYCFYLKGSWQKPEHQTELVVLTEDIDYDIQDFFDLSKSYIGPDYGKYRTTFKGYGDMDKWGIFLSARDVTGKGLIILCEQFGGFFTGELQTGEAFSLECSNSGDWKAVDTLEIGEYTWHQIAYKIKKNDITELRVDWEWLYGELEPGYYRMKKEFMDYRAAGDFDKETYELYFTVE